MKTGLALALLGSSFASAPAIADPCADPIDDPVPTPVHDTSLDAQRSACLRTDVGAALVAHALIDTPDFHGVLGGDLAITGRVTLREHLEIDASLRVLDYSFVQTAVNTVTEARFGPLAVGAVYATDFAPGARFAIAAALEIPATRDDMATTHTGGQLTAIVTGELASRWLLHARMGAIAASASSIGGDTQQLALRAGADAIWRARPSLAVLGGLEAQAGWYGGFDSLLVRAGIGVRPRGAAWRLLAGIGIPLGGNERTTVVLDVSLVRAL